ncbi:unnamed protein product [marine sediment metagenome]|uniref:Carboxypeptidase regulatory-like domain-containing protein n=1 Tax=marine sediment metagenome TaxID=412755 RepID=X1RMY3_9ZZZZ
MKMKRNLLYLTVLALGVSGLFACTQKPQESGILQGHVTIGPLVPAIREGDAEPTPAPEVYATREIVVFKGDGTTEFTRLTIDDKGNYRGELPVGTYVVDINRIGIDSAKDLPIKIEIINQGVTRLDINIDTGIR